MKSNSNKTNPFHRKAKYQPSEVVSYPIRLNKFIAKCGVCSRRKAIDLVKEGKIKLNGKVCLVPYQMVEESDQVGHEGKILQPERTLVYVLLNKPKNTITTASDEKNRKTVLDHINWRGPERLFPVGRLDRQTTGLLLITNDGDLAKKLAHPSHEVKKSYEATLDIPLSEGHLAGIKKGHQLDDGLVPVQEVMVSEKDDRIVTVTLSVGRNRIVRRLFESLGYEVRRLDRIYFAGLTKKNLPRGEHRMLTPREVVMLKHFT